MRIRTLPASVERGTMTPVTRTSVTATAGTVSITPTAAKTGVTNAMMHIKLALYTRLIDAMAMIYPNVSRSGSSKRSSPDQCNSGRGIHSTSKVTMPMVPVITLANSTEGREGEAYFL